MRSILTLLAVTLLVVPGSAHTSPAPIHYRLTVSHADLTALNVQMEVRGSGNFVVAAHAHPEYDDKYWRYLEGMTAEGGAVTRLDSVRWQVTRSSDVVTLRYRIKLPPAAIPRAAWRAYLTQNGGLVGGPHSFLYVVGAEDAAATVDLNMPAEWSAATALLRDGRTLRAPNMFALMESPILIGRMKNWTFDVEGVPHHIRLLQGQQPVQFDSAAFLAGVRGLVQQSVQMFRSMPYREYWFLVADDAYGGLEHPNSVTLGLRTADLAKDPHANLPEFAHEFFHTWNLMRIKPAEYRGVDFRVQPPVPGLWFSEGYSIFYADLLLRRSGAPVPTTRIEHLQNLLTRYYNDPAFEKFSPETISRVEYNSEPGALGNSDPSTHTIGETIAAALDFIVRARTHGRRSSDDILRIMNERFGARGFTGRDVERAASDACKCDLARFFNDHVRGAARIDFTELLRPLGLELQQVSAPVTNDRGEAERDFRIRAYQPAPDDTLRLMFWNENSNWVRGGLNTNDRVLSVNGTRVRTWPEFRGQIAAAPMGSTVTFEIVRAGRPMTVVVPMAGYSMVQVSIRENPNASNESRARRNEWLAGK